MLEDIIAAVLERTGDTSTGKGLVISNHLAQMRLFGIRQGLELYPIVDKDGTRKRFVDKLYEENKLELFLDRIWDLFLCKGQILWYLRPTGDFYRIYHYGKDQFKAYYDGDGELAKVIIIYSYKTETDINNIDRKRWVRLEITKEKILQSESDQQPNFSGPATMPMGPNIKVVENSLGFIPCVVANNYLVEAGQDGKGDFDWLKNQIETHEEMMVDIAGNLEFFGTPTLVTTRSAAEVTEAYGTGQRNLATNSQQWVSASQGSTFKRDPRGGGGRERIKRVMGGVQSDERFGYILPDPISPDQARFANEYRQSLHAAMGGLDPVGISRDATAFQIKSIYGTVAATARKKALHLYKYGLCKLVEMAVKSEEMAFKAGLRQALAIEEDAPPMSDAMCMAILDVMGMSPEEIKSQKPPDEIVSIVKKIPPDYRPSGLPPLGDRSIGWKWLGPVFEDSPQDLVQRSIVVRNLEELGVETTEALGFLFPDKTEVERKQMLTGFPFREMGQSASTLNQHLNILNQMLNLPSPNIPGAPLAAELNNMQAIQATIDHINRRLEYGRPRQQPAGDEYTGGYTSAPSGGADGPNGGIPNPGIGSNGPGISASLWSGGSISDAGRAAGIGYPSIGGNGIPSAGGNGPDRRLSEYSNGIPTPGGTIERVPSQTTPAAPSTPGYPGQLPSAITGVPIDLIDKPRILEQLFPSIFSAYRAIANPDRTANGGKPRGTKSRKSK